MSKSAKLNKQLRNLIISKLCWVGVLLMACYILLGTIVNHHLNALTVSTYAKEIENTAKEEKQSCLEKAIDYNTLLYQAEAAFGNINEEIFTDEYYTSLLNLSDTSVMARLIIPKIAVDLPVYHGTDEAALSHGVGHLQGSSLPVGGTNTHAILSAHRGVPTAKLFTRLDELTAGDYIFIDILDERLAYRVKEIQVISPDDTAFLEIIPNKDLISLVTCTPYAINTHRLVVTCERSAYTEQAKTDIPIKLPSLRETTLSYLLPTAAAGASIIYLLKQYKKGKE